MTALAPAQARYVVQRAQARRDYDVAVAQADLDLAQGGDPADKDAALVQAFRTWDQAARQAGGAYLRLEGKENKGRVLGVAGAQRGAAVAEADASKDFRVASAAAARTFQVAESAANFQQVQTQANVEADFAISSAESYAVALGLAFYGTDDPWGQRQVTLAQKQADQVQEVATADRDLHIGEAQAARDKEQTAAAAADRAEQRKAAAQWLWDRARAEAGYVRAAAQAQAAQDLANHQANALQQGGWLTFAWYGLANGSVSGLVQMPVPAAEHGLAAPLSSAVADPHDRFFKLDDVGQFGMHGDQRFYRGLVGQMFTTGPGIGPGLNNLTGFWNSGQDLGYSNGLQMFLAEKLARPWLGDNFLATASQGQLFWAFVGAGLQVGADWGLDLALKLNDKLWDGAFAAAYRASEIYLTFWRGEVLEAKMHCSDLSAAALRPIGSAKAKLASRLLRGRLHQLADGLENHLKFLVVLAEFMLQLIQRARQVLVGGEDLP